jgi:hypothetical protein
MLHKAGPCWLEQEMQLPNFIAAATLPGVTQISLHQPVDAV